MQPASAIMQKENKQKHFAVLRYIQLFYRATTFCATCDEDRYEFPSPYLCNRHNFTLTNFPHKGLCFNGSGHEHMITCCFGTLPLDLIIFRKSCKTANFHAMSFSLLPHKGKNTNFNLPLKSASYRETQF